MLTELRSSRTPPIGSIAVPLSASTTLRAYATNQSSETNAYGDQYSSR